MRMGVIKLSDVTSTNIGYLRQIIQVVFPVNFNDKFYNEILESGPLAKAGEFFSLFDENESYFSLS